VASSSHALELNGLRSWQENRQTQSIAQRWNQLVISGGDRHGIQPNANTNLTHAASFDEFVDEVRRDRISHILFMAQYAEPWRHRIFQATLDVIRNYPDSQGNMRPVSQLWPGNGSARLSSFASFLAQCGFWV
jgi:hypothetical protein